jgi:trimeric autotransporter adhesin
MTAWGRRLVLGCAALFAAGPLMAQTYHGGLRGAVRDPDGVTPGVAVALVNEATNATRHATTNQVGEYAFVNVEPGTYTVKVSMTAFKTIENKGVHIGTQQFLTLDFTLEVGKLEEQVTVEGGGVALETSNASVSSTIDSKTLQTLPTAGRNPFFLATITPGVTHTGDPQFVRQQDQTNSSLLSLGGGPRRGNNYTLDGVAIVDLRNRATVIPSIEAVEEVKVQVTTYDAEMGRTGGGVFNMTGKSGANAWHGSLLGQTRPASARALSYFAKKACEEGSGSCEKPDTYFYLYGGSFGGPIVKNKTFFWGSFEGYKTDTIDDSGVRAPNARELGGDFSQSGVTIYDPLTTRPDPNNPGQFIRTPFPGNVIPANRMSPVANAMRQYWPEAGPASSELVDRSRTATLKLDQVWTDNVRTSAMYAYYHSAEPQPRSYLKDGKTQEVGANPADPGDGALYRTVHALAINNTITPNSTTVAHVRLGYTSFSDDCVPTAFDPGTLGFSPAFVSEVPVKKFPYFAIGSYGTDYNGYMFGDRPINDISYYSWDANASVSKLWGRHTAKFGASYRKIGVKNFNPSQASGRFFFDGQFTSADPLSPDSADPYALAAFLLGYPSDGSIPVAKPTNAFINYYAGYAQDDFRVNSKLTVNVGLRYEFEQGLQEVNNDITVGFDRSVAWPVQIPGGPALKGGLEYAGVDGYPTHQSDPSKMKLAPRVGFAWAPNPKTVVRGGYGLFWAPHQYAGISATSLGTRGFTQVTDYIGSTDGGLTPCAGCSIVNPFPNGISQPTGNADGILTGAGGTVQFVDQFRKSAYVHQYSVDLQRELPGRIVAGIGYIGATSRRLGLGGNDDATININQLDPQYQSLGSALLDQVPNPFFGNPAFGAFADQETITRGQLLRPYPQFGDVLAGQVSEGRAQYHSVVVRLERPMVGGWGGRINYTWSSNKNNIFGELNQFSNNSGSRNRPVNSYDVDAEYAPSITEQPHRLNFALTGELPFGKGKKHLSSPGLARVLFGGWSITGVGYFQSGFPVTVIQGSNNSGVFGRVQRPNLTSTSPATSGNTDSHYDADCGCIANWFDPAAYSLTPAFTFGDAPRTDSRMRTPFKTQTDMAFQKVEPLGGTKEVMVRFEVINIFNNTQFNGPDTTFGSSAFGTITGTRGFPRLLQLMVRFAF